MVNGTLGKVVDFLTGYEAVNGNTDIGLVDPTHEVEADTRKIGDNKNVPSHILESSSPWPVVEWASGRKMMMVPVQFTIENVHGEVEATRGQVGNFPSSSM